MNIYYLRFFCIVLRCVIDLNRKICRHVSTVTPADSYFGLVPYLGWAQSVASHLAIWISLKLDPIQADVLIHRTKANKRLLCQSWTEK